MRCTSEGASKAAPSNLLERVRPQDETSSAEHIALAINFERPTEGREASSSGAAQARRLAAAGSFCQGRLGRSDSGKSRLTIRSYMYDSLTVPRLSL